MRRLLLLAGLALFATPIVAQSRAATTVILVRHAEKDTIPEGDPGLTPAGTARAQALSALLADRPVEAVLVSEYARTRLTAEPTATRLGLTPEVVPARGGLGAHAAAIAALVRGRYAGKTVLVVGHSNTIPAIIAALGREVDPICDGSFSNLYVVSVNAAGGATVEQRHYGAADPPDACDATNP